MSNAQAVPKKFGLLLYPGFEVLDVFGPIEALNVISREKFNDLEPKDVQYIPGITLSVISSESTLEPITPVSKSGAQGSNPFQKFEPAFTVYDAPSDLDVLIVPGGLGSDDINPDAVEWLREQKERLPVLFTVCTGADIAARAGALDGLRATTNKQAWGWVTSKDTSAKTYWVAHARWVKASDRGVDDGGVSAGTDGFVAWIKDVYGEALGVKACQWMEYSADTASEPDAFSAGLSDVPPRVLEEDPWPWERAMSFVDGEIEFNAAVRMVRVFRRAETMSLTLS